MGASKLKPLGLRKFDIGGHAVNLIDVNLEVLTNVGATCMVLFASVFASQVANGDLLS